jgi:hypothetical protein
LRDRLDEFDLGLNEAEVWESQDLRGKLRPLREAPPNPLERLDIPATVQATAAHAGLFVPVWEETARRRRNVMLVEQVSAFDHLAHLFARAAYRLRADQIDVALFGYLGSLATLFPDEQRQPVHGLERLIGGASAERLIIVGAGTRFVDAMRGVVNRNIDDTLRAWPYRYLLSTKPVRNWGATESALLASGLSLGTATSRGLAALARAAEGAVEGPTLLDVRLDRPGTATGP